LIPNPALTQALLVHLQPPSESAADADFGASVEAVVEMALISEKRIRNESCCCPSS
jgi:hypothetical protein